MSRILKRPMFRKGGSANNGIMHGLVDRKGYRQGTGWDEVVKKYPHAQEAYNLMSTIDKPRDTSMYEMLIGGGLNLVSGRGAGSGLMSNIARSYKEPSEKYFQSSRAIGDYDRKLKQAAAQAGLEQKWGLEQIAAKKDDPYNKYFAEKAAEEFPDFNRSQLERVKNYNLTEGQKLADKVGNNRVGGLIDFDLNNTKEKKKRLPKLKKDIGKYFYDPRDGKYKLLVEQNGQLGFVEFDSVDNITFGLEEGVSTETSTPYADAQAFREQEKQEAMLEGDVTDQDIMGLSQRFL